MENQRKSSKYLQRSTSHFAVSNTSPQPRDVEKAFKQK
jgi:hypothetical protein